MDIKNWKERVTQSPIYDDYRQRQNNFFIVMTETKISNV
jgi:hypothetical protein